MIAWAVVKRTAAALVLGTFACGGEPDPEPAAIPPATCAAPEVALPDGSCIRPGVPADGCGSGFRHDGDYGCEAILPDACPPGKMAIPGDASCRAPMDCAPGKWGAIPVDGTTVYVDASFAGTSDGSAAKPFTTVAKGYAAVPAGGIVAIAAGSYGEDVVVNGKPARFWGVCPSLVELAGTGKQIMPLQITQSAASGSEVHGIAFRGPKHGLGVAGATGVVVDRVWIHATGLTGFGMVGYFGATSAKLQGSLIEDTHIAGINAVGVTLEIEGTVVRHNHLLAKDDPLDAGVSISACLKPSCPGDVKGAATLRRSLVEENEDIGVAVLGSDVVLEDSAVRRNLPSPLDQTLGVGIEAVAACHGMDCTAALPASLTLRRSLLGENRDLAVWARGAAVTIERSTVTGTLPQASDALFGRGLEIEAFGACPAGGCFEGPHASLTLRESLVADNHNVGVYVYGADALFDGAVVRDTAPRAKDQRFGVGVELLPACAPTPTACNLLITGSSTVRGTLIEHSQWGGLLFSSGEGLFERMVVRSTTAGVADGLFGDGIVVSSDWAPGSATLRQVRVETSARAGVGNFGGTMALEGNTIRCSGFDLEGEVVGLKPFRFEDRGGNRCGCDALVACQATSAGLTPPSL